MIAAILSGLLMGLAGSLHCVGMCGPLLLALPLENKNKTWGLLIYHGARVLCYGLLGVLMAGLGVSFRASGVHETISLTLGIVLLLGVALFYSGILKSKFRDNRWWLSKVTHKVWRAFYESKKIIYLFPAGFLNGLLPCGLVYAALGVSLSLPEPTQSVEYMLAFGVGTSPALLALGFISRYFTPRIRHLSRYLVPIGAISAAVLLILRGLSIGIPYISPILATQPHCCH